MNYIDVVWKFSIQATDQNDNYCHPDYCFTAGLINNKYLCSMQKRFWNVGVCLHIQHKNAR